jgi:arsenate reductase
MTDPIDIVIYHNPACGTSRNTLAMIRNAGIEPHVVEYLKTPPSRRLLEQLVARMGIPLRALVREKGTPYEELGLGDPALTDGQILDAMMQHPILINRPIVVSPLGVKLCRPSEVVNSSSGALSRRKTARSSSTRAAGASSGSKADQSK